MSTATAQLVERYRAWPRALQWGALAAIGIAAFLLWDSLIRPLSDDLNRQSQVIESNVSNIRASMAIADELKKIERVAECLGPVTKPGGRAEGATDLNRIVNDVLKKHAVTNQSFDMRVGGKLPTGALMTVSGGKRPERLAGDLRFTSSTDEAIAIISELESSPEIEMIKSVRMTKDANRKVKVNLSLEAWVLPVESTKGGGA
jgi:hypothetical protein